MISGMRAANGIWSIIGYSLLSVDLQLFFFQAEDGIRDIGVTGVQTCALPISLNGKNAFDLIHPDDMPQANDLFEQTLEKPGMNITTELRLLHSSGVWRGFVGG